MGPHGTWATVFDEPQFAAIWLAAQTRVEEFSALLNPS
jgi:hypothetical protein